PPWTVAQVPLLVPLKPESAGHHGGGSIVPRHCLQIPLLVPLGMGRRERCLRAAACQTHRVDDSSAGRLTDLLARLWPGRSCEWRPLAGGITNRNFLVDVEGERYVLRMAGKDTHLLGIDRRAEAAAARMAAAV